MWVSDRNSGCGFSNDGQYFEDVNCALQITEARLKDLTQKYRVRRDVERLLSSNTDNASVVGPFKARYFCVDRFVASEIVDRPSINYALDDFYNIASDDFYGIWESVIDIRKGGQVVTANFDASWSDIAIYVDDTLFLKWSNGSKSVPIRFLEGSHKLRIEYHNHHHTADFNVSFYNPPKISVKEASKVIVPCLDESTRIYHIEVHESENVHNKILLTLPPTDDSIFLFLSSRSPVNWVIHNPDSVYIAGVAITSHSPGVTVNNIDKDIPIFDVYDLKYISSPEIKSMTGRDPSYSLRVKGVTQVIIPNI